jgi:ribosomal protein L16/L10AE
MYTTQQARKLLNLPLQRNTRVAIRIFAEKVLHVAQFFAQTTFA